MPQLLETVSEEEDFEMTWQQSPPFKKAYTAK